VKNGHVNEENVYFIATDDGVQITSSNIIELPHSKVVFEKKDLPIGYVNTTELEKWATNSVPPDPCELYVSLKDILKYYIELPPVSYGLVAVWIMGTYFYRAFPSYPYLNFLGPKETGKSNTLELIEKLAFNAVKTRLTVAALGDTADSLRGTIITDQAHNLSPELIDILVDGYKKGGGKRRVVEITNKGRKVLEFDSYCPKVFASLEPLPEDLADRTFTINMAPAAKDYPCPSASHRDWTEIRTSLVKLTLRAHRDIYQMIHDINEPEGQRFGELWLPIEVILTLVCADEEEVDEIKKYCEQQFSQVKYELREWDYELVSIVSNSDTDEISAKELLEKLQSVIDGEARPGKQWLGRAVQRLGLIREKKGGKHHKTTYVLNKEQAVRLLGEVGEVGDSCFQTSPDRGLASTGDSGEVVEYIDN
jgi:hypothetical protein